MSNHDLHILLFIIVANGAPIIGARLFTDYFNQPIDFSLKFYDGYPLFGPAKTWRGLLFSLIATSLCTYLFLYSFMLGLKIAAAALLGDLISSFIKRRLHKASSSRAFILDQIPECLLPLLVIKYHFNLHYSDIVILCILFTIIEITLSIFLHKLNIRKHPY